MRKRDSGGPGKNVRTDDPVISRSSYLLSLQARQVVVTLVLCRNEETSSHKILIRCQFWSGNTIATRSSKVTTCSEQVVYSDVRIVLLRNANSVKFLSQMLIRRITAKRDKKKNREGKGKNRKIKFALSIQDKNDVFRSIHFRCFMFEPKKRDTSRFTE